jgi:hypothetical protein
MIDPEAWRVALASEERNRTILAMASEKWAMVEKSLTRQ